MFLYKLFIICFSVELAYGQRYNSSCECGIAGTNRRIVGGTTAQPHQYPWLVALMLGSKLHCGGAIISDLHILTAGHCITFGVHYRDLKVHVGMHDRLDNTFEIRKVTNGVKHPKFTSNAVRDINDLAVLTLDKRVKFDDKVRPICLPDEDMEFDNIPLTVAGWGKIRQGALTSSRHLLETKVKIVPYDKCRKTQIYKDNLVSNTMMCAYAYGKDACQGDSGGPLFSTHSSTDNRKWYHVGIVSWGIDCAMPDYPGVYTVVAKYVDWIKKKARTGNIVYKKSFVFYQILQEEHAVEIFANQRKLEKTIYKTCNNIKNISEKNKMYKCCIIKVYQIMSSVRFLQ